jgi:hypothetical protein
MWGATAGRAVVDFRGHLITAYRPRPSGARTPEPGVLFLSVAVATGIGENGGDCEGAAAVTDESRVETRDERHCFRCGRDLGPLGEWKKMDTEAGPICYVCFNEAAAGERGRERPR